MWEKKDIFKDVDVKNHGMVDSSYITKLRVEEDDLKSGVDLIKLNDGSVCEFPIYNLDFIPPLHCVKYARIVANEVFGKRYAPSQDCLASAWDLHLVYETIQVHDFQEQFRNGEIGKGDLIGIYHPGSRFNKNLDREGKPVRYTHVGVFLGELPSGTLILGEQRISERRVVSLRQLIEINNRPVEIIRDTLLRRAS